ncbi:hypothetical protein CWI42_040890 [Ordospora colligata]|uniref:Exocyst complex component Sec10-like alpha-helical bundle domain-containing protein n=1 Tax=Ordospora colligata OC4 TaxID=1354746 RepID=A0A0B2UKW9_9MICR|nr:uncharacterized protein M896_040890 [Ordospora colligata OC4]KHN69894.1 hypothetical protein M896_040890 [Ordospora colligata OC4]TBU16064.1 hypothetical protein CWI41_040890 [Ordospora colligata]TBU16277.1 hypothetical protein CWI40_040890 [Ordospora colligata]TBU18981.1 hypothetical protein CWI42_040890 [Ordospora colligata]
MRSIHVSQLRAGSFSLESLVDEMVVIEEESLKQTREGLVDVLKDLEGIREGLLFKRERLGQKIRSIEEGVKLDKIDELVAEINGLSMEPLGTSREILERNREILNLKEIRRAVQYAVEIGKGNFSVIEGLCTSDDEQDWRFLCFLLANIGDVGEGSQEILRYNKVVEEKMLEVFEEGRKSNNKTAMRSAYNALEEMDKGISLINVYLYSFELFKKPVSMKCNEEDVLDLDFYVGEGNMFTSLVDMARETYENDFRNLEEIFPNTKKAYGVIHKKVYEDVLYKGLRDWLDGLSPCMFLLSLEGCCKNIKVLGSVIEEIDSKFDSERAMQDLISQYVTCAIENEKRVFDEIYEAIVKKKRCRITYIVLGTEVGMSDDLIFGFKQLLDVMSFAFERANRLYGEVGKDDLEEYFSRRMGEFVGVVYGSIKEKLKAVKILKYMYLVSKKYFADRFWKLKTFRSRIDENLNEAFEEHIRSCRIRIGARIKEERFVEKGRSIRVIEIARYEFDKASEMSIKGKHYRVLVGKVLYSVYHFLYNQVVQMVFDELQSANVVEYVSDIIEFAMGIGCVEAVPRLGYLKDLCMLIAVPRDGLESLYETLLGRVSESEMQRILRCRKDRGHVNSKTNIMEMDMGDRDEDTD